MRRRSYQIDAVSPPKYKYSFNEKTYDLNVSSSFDNRIGAYRAKENTILLEDKIKSSGNFTLEKLLAKDTLGPISKYQSRSLKN